MKKDKKNIPSIRERYAFPIITELFISVLLPFIFVYAILATKVSIDEYEKDYKNFIMALPKSNRNQSCLEYRGRHLEWFLFDRRPDSEFYKDTGSEKNLGELFD